MGSHVRSSDPCRKIAIAAELFDDAIVRDVLADHGWRESYVCETGKSMKAPELPVFD
jgi:hypothetical protein